MIITKSIESNDGMAIKFTQQTIDNHEIETLYVDYPNKHIICYSTQVGCNGQCKFCYTGIKGRLIRNMKVSEIIDQCINVIKYIHPSDDKPILFSAMGIGDPLNNLSEYIYSARKLKDIFPLAKFALATRVPDHCCITSLTEFHAGLNLKLMISLHTANDELRSKLIPRSIPVNDIIVRALRYEQQTGNPVEYNVTLISGLNDSDNDAVIISDLLRNAYKNTYIIPKVKINKFNKIPNTVFEPSVRVPEFMSILSSHGIQPEYYETNGSDIGGACGQMVSK